MAMQQRHHTHPVIKAGVVGVAVVVAAVFVLSAMSFIVGLLWLVVKVVLVAALLAGLVHLGRGLLRNRSRYS